MGYEKDSMHKPRRLLVLPGHETKDGYASIYPGNSDGCLMIPIFSGDEYRIVYSPPARMIDKVTEAPLFHILEIAGRIDTREVKWIEPRWKGWDANTGVECAEEYEQLGFLIRKGDELYRDLPSGKSSRVYPPQKAAEL